MSSVKSDLPLIPLRDVVVFPGIVTTLFVGRAKSVEALNIAMSSNKKLVLVSQKDASNEDPDAQDIFQYGSISNLLQLIKLPDGTMKVLVEGHKRCFIEKVIEKDNYTLARVTEEIDKPLKESESKNIIRLNKVDKIYLGVQKINNKYFMNKSDSNEFAKIFRPDIKKNLMNGWQGRLCWNVPFICSYNKLDINKKNGYLIISKLKN